MTDSGSPSPATRCRGARGERAVCGGAPRGLEELEDGASRPELTRSSSAGSRPAAWACRRTAAFARASPIDVPRRATRAPGVEAGPLNACRRRTASSSTPPQRQRTIGSPSSRSSNSLPSASISRIGPVTLYGPLCRALISAGLESPGNELRSAGPARLVSPAARPGASGRTSGSSGSEAARLAARAAPAHRRRPRPRPRRRRRPSRARASAALRGAVIVILTSGSSPLGALARGRPRPSSRAACRPPSAPRRRAGPRCSAGSPGAAGGRPSPGPSPSRPAGPWRPRRG